MIARLAISFFVAFLVWPSHLAAWKEPDHFMGIKFFSDVTKALPECRKDTNGICWEDRGSSYKIRGIPADIFSEVRAYMVDRKLAYLDLDFHWEMYPQTLAIFTERYGAPSSLLNETWTNSLGAKFPNQTALWQGKLVSIMLRRHSVSLDRGEGHYMTELWREHSAKLSQDSIRKRAKGL